MGQVVHAPQVEGTREDAGGGGSALGGREKGREAGKGRDETCVCSKSKTLKPSSLLASFPSSLPSLFSHTHDPSLPSPSLRACLPRRCGSPPFSIFGRTRWLTAFDLAAAAAAAGIPATRRPETRGI